jgi:hypothetical protein
MYSKQRAKKNEPTTRFDLTMMLTGCSPERWRQVTNAVLLKKAGVYEGNKL